MKLLELCGKSHKYNHLNKTDSKVSENFEWI